jgi:hypothetical protein
MRAPKPVERLAVHAVAIALTHQRVKAPIWLEAKPLQIFENAGFIFRPAANPIVILHAQQHASPGGASHAPHVNRVHDVTEVQVSGWRRGVAGEH